MKLSRHYSLANRLRLKGVPMVNNRSKEHRLLHAISFEQLLQASSRKDDR